MNKFIIILLLSHLVCVPHTFSLPNKNEDENLFHEINRNLANTLNGIFTLLQLSKNFTYESKNKILLSLHGNIKTVAERNYKAYKIVKKSTKLFYEYKPSSAINLQRLCDIIVQDTLIPDNATKFSAQANKTGINLHLTSIEIPNKLEDSISFLKEYFSNVEDTYALSIDSPLYQIKKEYEKNRYKRKMRRNLRAWKAANDTKDLLMNYSDTRRLYHGRKVRIKKYPFLASIHVLTRFVCAGSIISKNMILTAATCLHAALTNKRFLQDNPEGVAVRVGSAYTQRLGEVRFATQIFFHPKYNIDDLRNNLAILKIDRLYFTKNKKIRRVEYARWKGEGLPSHFKEIIMLGWGDKETQISGEFDPLSYSILNVFNQTRCVLTYSRKYVNENNFCAGFVNKRSGACQRDVGGPAIVGSTLVGVISFGPPVCGTPNAPTVFSSVSFHAGWIDSIIRKKSSKNKEQSRIASTVLNKDELPITHSNREPFDEEPQTTLDAKNKSIVIPKSQYPQAIQVLQHLLTKLTNEEKKAETNYVDKKSDDGIVVDFDDLAKINEKTTTNKAVKLNVMRAENNTETPTEAKTNDVVKINTGKIMDDVVTGLQTELMKQFIMTGSVDPFFLAVKSLGNYLGLEKMVHVTEDYKLTSTRGNVESTPRPKNDVSTILPSDEIITIDLEQDSTTHSRNLGADYFATSYFPHISSERIQLKADDSFNENFSGNVISKGQTVMGDTESVEKTLNDIIKKEENSSNRQNQFEPIDIEESNDSNNGYSEPDDLSDNYESESKGLSIEVLPSASRTTDKIQIGPAYFDRAEQFLSKNFVKDNNLILTQDDKSDELVVLLVSKATTKMTEITDKKLRRQIRLNVNGTPIMLPSRYSIISNIKNIILVETNGTKNKPENQMDVDVVHEFFTNISEATTLARSFDDKKSHLLQTPESEPSYRSNTNVSILKTVTNNEFTVITTPYTITSANTTLTSSNSSIFNNSTTASNIVDTYTTLASSSFDNSMVTNISSSTTERELTMAAYDIAEVVAEVKKEEEDDSDIEDPTNIFDYINMT